MKRKTPLPKIPTIPSMEWDKIVTESQASHELLTASKFQFFRTYLENAKQSILLKIANNDVKDVVETITDPKTNYSKTFKTTKEEQLNEMAGEFKFITKLLSDLSTLSQQETEYMKLQDKRRVVIELSKESNGGETL